MMNAILPLVKAVSKGVRLIVPLIVIYVLLVFPLLPVFPAASVTAASTVGGGDYVEDVSVDERLAEGANRLEAISEVEPNNASPSNQATGISLTPTLTSSAFSAPDAGDTHAASQWQVTATARDFAAPVLTFTSQLLSPNPNWRIRNILVDGRTMYLCEEDNGKVSTWDVSVPSAPVKLGEVATATYSALDVRKKGDYLFVTGRGTDSIYSINVADPANPVLADTLTDAVFLDAPHGSYLEGDYLYVAAFGGDRLTIVDISDPEDLVLRGSLNAPSLDGAHDVAVSYPYAYVASHYGTGGGDTDGEITSLDVSDPDHPTVQDVSREKSQFAHIVKEGPYLFVGGSPDDLYAYDVSTPTSLSYLGRVGGSYGYWIAVRQGYAFTVNGGGRLAVIDISDPANMVRVLAWSDPGTSNLRNMVLEGDYAYVSGSGADGGIFQVLKVFDTAAPATTNLQPADGTTVTDAAPAISASYSDDSSEINTALVRLWLDGVDVTAESTLNETGIVYLPSHPLSYGLHTVELYVEDNQGNSAAATWSFNLLAMHVWNLPAGWSMISLPVMPDNPDPNVVFASLPYFILYTWDSAAGAYVQPELLQPGVAYWILVLEAARVEVRGMPVQSYTVSLGQGWSMIGSTSLTVSLEDTGTDPAGALFRYVYGWDPVSNRYYVTDILEPGVGYWALAFEDCMLTVEPPPPPA